MRICTLGDLLVDVIVRAPGPLAPGADTPVETRVTSGGQAANVAAWVAALGEQARFIGKQAGDEAGVLARSQLERLGVDHIDLCTHYHSSFAVFLVYERYDKK